MHFSQEAEVLLLVGESSSRLYVCFFSAFLLIFELTSNTPFSFLEPIFTLSLFFFFFFFP